MESKPPEVNGDEKNIRNRLTYSKALSITAVESRSGLDQRKGL